jgi:hypothetical protein
MNASTLPLYAALRASIKVQMPRGPGDSRNIPGDAGDIHVNFKVLSQNKKPYYFFSRPWGHS